MNSHVFCELDFSVIVHFFSLFVLFCWISIFALLFSKFINFTISEHVMKLLTLCIKTRVGFSFKKMQIEKIKPVKRISGKRKWNETTRIYLVHWSHHSLPRHSATYQRSMSLRALIVTATDLCNHWTSGVNKWTYWQCFQKKLYIILIMILNVTLSGNLYCFRDICTTD